MAAAKASERRRIWLCADDYGISPAVSVAIRDLLVRGRLNATSVMVVAPSFHQAEASALVTLMAAQPRIAVGLHVTLSAPFAPLGGDFAPLRDGAFLPLGRLLGEALARRLKPGLLREEVTRQVRRSAGPFGCLPDFIAVHPHVQLFPQIRDAVLAAARELAPIAWVRQCGSPGLRIAKLADPKGLLIDVLSGGFRRRAQILGVRTNSAFAGTYRFDEEADFATLFPR